MGDGARTVVFAAPGRPPAGHADVAVLPELLSEVAALCMDPDPAARPPARSVVLNLLGNVELPAGVLAEGMRRASLSGPYTANQHQPHARPRHSAAGTRTPRPAPTRPAQPGPAPAGSAQPMPARPGPGQLGPAPTGAAPMAAANRPGPPPLPSGQAGTARQEIQRRGTTRQATADAGQRHHPPHHLARRPPPTLL